MGFRNINIILNKSWKIFLPGGLRSSSWSFLILLLLSGRLNLLESVLFDIEEVELFELLELDELEFPFTVLVVSLSNLTSHFFAAVWQTTPPPVKKTKMFLKKAINVLKNA